MTKVYVSNASNERLRQEALGLIEEVEEIQGGNFSSPLYPGVVFHAIPDPQPDIIEYVRKQTQHEEVTCEVLGNAILFQQGMDSPC